MELKRNLIQARDVFAMRAHFGWAHFLVRKAAKLPVPAAQLAEVVHERLSEITDLRSAAFDAEHGTETFARSEVAVRESVPPAQLSWGYGPINQDFFREIMRAVPFALERFTFVDVGSGKGAAVMLAADFNFRRYVGVELDAELVEIARENLRKFNQKTGLLLEVEWERRDFMKWPLPGEDALYFFNNPFPPELSLRAVERIENSLLERPRRVLLVYRKAPELVGRHLHESTLWTPIRLAPYWRIYASPSLGRASLNSPGS